MNLWFVLAVNSVTLGGLLFLLSAGFSLIFGVARIVNIAHTAFYMLAAYCFYTLLTRTGLGFLLSGVIILFTIATLMALAFLIGVVTSSTGVSLMATYAVFFFAAILAAHDKISAAVSTELAARIVDGLYWVLPKTAELGQATVALVAGAEAPERLAHIDVLAVYGSTALFGAASLALASWLFSRKDF